jgi:hypothetical protein
MSFNLICLNFLVCCVHGLNYYIFCVFLAHSQLGCVLVLSQIKTMFIIPICIWCGKCIFFMVLNNYSLLPVSSSSVIYVYVIHVLLSVTTLLCSGTAVGEIILLIIC